MTKVVRPRSPWLYYLYVFLSAGIFLFPWIVMMMNDINRFERRSVLPVTYFKFFFVIALPIYALLIVLAGFSLDPPWLTEFWIASVITLCIAIYVSIVVAVILISRHVTKSLGANFRLRQALLLIALTVFWYASLIVIQRQLNRLLAIDRTQNE